MKIIGIRTIKTVIAVPIAITLANQFNLKYAVAAGIIAMLSIQSTKRESIQIAFQRMGACILALATSSLLFIALGYTPVIFGVFLLIFIPITAKFKLEQGIVVSSVIVTHLLVEKNISLALITNELSLMVIGILVALLLNLYMPSIEKKILDDQRFIEEGMKSILLKMHTALIDHDTAFSEEPLFESLRSRIEIAKSHAYKNLNNYITSDMSYYVKYIEMRNQQFETLKRLRNHFRSFFNTYEHTNMVADFTKKISEDFYEKNNCENLLIELSELRTRFKNMPLPQSREEFENRAMLYQFLNDLEQFLLIKVQFIKNI